MKPITRREAIGAMAGIAVAGTATAEAVTAGMVTDAVRIAEPASPPSALKQSVARWCYSNTPLEELCAAARDIGLVAVDLLTEEEWPVAAKYGLQCSLASGFGTIPIGFNRIEHHDKLVADGERLIERAAGSGVPGIVCFSGNRDGLSHEEGIANCITGLKRLMPAAERHGVTLCMEMLNSKVDHRDYHADTTPWAVQVAKGVGSPRFRLLYDIYHMQIMEGNVIATIRDNVEYFAHYHTGGVPGRAEIDDTQELNYRRIAQAIIETGFTGYLAHEFIPRRDPFTSLRQAFEICDLPSVPA